MKNELSCLIEDFRICVHSCSDNFGSDIDRDRYQIQSYRYSYGHKYGSPQLDRKVHFSKRVNVSEDKFTVSLKLDQVEAGKVYQIDLVNLFSSDGLPIINPMVCYTVNQLR